MVIDVGAAKAGDFDAVEADIAAVRAAVPAPDGAQGHHRVRRARPTTQIVGVCRAAVAAGADFVKTSTGFHPAGGATVHAVRADGARPSAAALGVKASGGIRTAADALAMIDAGATRLGLSATGAVLAGLDGGAGY